MLALMGRNFSPGSLDVSQAQKSLESGDERPRLRASYCVPPTFLLSFPLSVDLYKFQSIRDHLNYYVVTDMIRSLEMAGRY